MQRLRHAVQALTAKNGLGWSPERSLCRASVTVETHALFSLCTWEVGPGPFPWAPELTAWLALTLRAFTFLSGLEGTASPSGAILSTEVFLEGTQCGPQRCL